MKNLFETTKTVLLIVFALILFTSCSSDDDAVEIMPDDGVITQSIFASDAEGWTIIGDAQGGYVAASYSPDGGVTDGYIYADDDVRGGYWFFKAPNSYTGDKSEYYGATLNFSQFQDSDMSSQRQRDDIVFKSGNEQITYVHGFDNFPGADWTQYSITISAGSQWLKGDYNSGVTATEAEIKAVLSNVTEFLIRGEFEHGWDSGGLDNVVISK